MSNETEDDNSIAFFDESSNRTNGLINGQNLREIRELGSFARWKMFR